MIIYTQLGEIGCYLLKNSEKFLKTLALFINMVQYGGMSNKIKGGEDIRRLSVSFSHKIYDSLEEIAASKKVSIAWVVRDAVEIYTKNQKDSISIIPDVKNV